MPAANWCSPVPVEILTPSGVFRPLVVIPVYDHEHAIAGVVDGVRAAGLPCLLVDDGSRPSCAAVLQLLAHRGEVSLLRLPVNQGKGGAMLAGFAEAARQGFSHVLQIDADGQHDTGDLPRFIAAARELPQAVICGIPAYDASVPKARLYGRYATHVWVWINTLSLQLRDTMCGFRVYPLSPVLRLMAEESIGRRMDFDTEILVRLFWRQISVRHLSTKVTYPVDGVSHFDVWRDNLRISRMHTRLFFGMLRRAPGMLWVRLRGGTEMAGRLRSPHWAELGESTSVVGMLFLSWVYRWFGRWPFRICAWPVVACHWLANDVGRGASMEYLQLLQAYTGVLGHEPTWRDSLRHFFTFADTLLDKILGLGGRYPVSRIQLQRDLMLQKIKAQQGGLILTAHIGCLELCQVLAEQVPGFHVTVLVHTAHAQRFNRLLQRLAPLATVELLQVTSIGPATAVVLAEKVAAGGFVAIVGDRVPVDGGRTVTADFLGRPAAFPIGAYVLAAALGCPVFCMSCLHRGKGYWVAFEQFAERIVLPRGSRDASLAEQAQRFSGWLERQVIQSPLDWFNFFPFWDQVAHED